MRREEQVRIKHTLDRAAGAVLLIALLPVFLIIALLVKLDDGGPVLFRQARPGLHETPFTVWKFRTMVQDADRLLDEQGRVQRTENRITRVGRILRLFSLDELPQLVNIVRGEMSFIGPRPPLREHLERYTPEQRGRFAMRPGITGLAQVNGRNRLAWSRRIEYDLEYIREYSLALDARILFRTVGVVLRREGLVMDRNPEQADDLPMDAERG